VLKLAEAMINMAALVVRFGVKPPAVVHVQYLPMLRWRVPVDVWFLGYCRRRGAKIVLTVHDLLPHDTAEQHRRTFERLYGFVDGLICHSGHIRTRLAEEFGVPDGKVFVIPHGPFFYDLPVVGADGLLRGMGVESDGVMVLWQGIIFPYKGIDLLLAAWQRVEASGVGATLVIAGTGAPELLAEIEGRIAGLGLKRVRLVLRFLSTEELVALYRRAEVVVYPYRAITTSGALATGLALGKTIVASDLPVFRELLTDGESARLVDPTDAEALAGALTELARSAELRERLAERVRAMRFGDESWAAIARQTEAAYAAVLGDAC
jgi:glycosyltransferase involved in cell wall biosynthesis